MHVDTLAAVEWAPVASTMMEQLSEDDQMAVRACLGDLTRAIDPARCRQVTRTRPGQRPFFVLRATPALRVLFERTEDSVRVLDVVGAEQWAYFRGDPIAGANPA